MHKYFYILLALFISVTTSIVYANTTVPQKMVYNGHLLSPTGAAITTAHTIRFSIWNSTDYTVTDTVAGAINTGAPTYLGWQEEHTVTPDVSGYFSVELGDTIPLFDIVSLSSGDLQNMFLQVEVKQSAEPITAYEVLDINPANTSIDRTPVLSVPFALNADYLDQHEIGTGSGDIALLGDGGTFSPSFVPGGTYANAFTIDFNNDETGNIVLQFGATLGKTLSYNQLAGYFNFNDDVNITGNLYVSGLINGIDITALSAMAGGELIVSNGTNPLSINVSSGNFRISGQSQNYAGATNMAVVDNATNYVYLSLFGLQINQTGFPTNASIIKLAEVVTSGGAITTITGKRETLVDDREQVKLVTLSPAYAGASYIADGSNNVGALKIAYDNTNEKNHYIWSTTKNTQQDYIINVEVHVPSDFVGFEPNALQIDYKTTNATVSDNKIDISTSDTAHNPVSLSGTFSNLASTSWATTSIGFTGSPVWTKNNTFIVSIHVYAKQGFDVQLGALKLMYKAI